MSAKEESTANRTQKYIFDTFVKIFSTCRQAGRTNALSHITLARTILSDDNGRNAEYGKITFTYWSIVSEGDNLWPNWGFNVPNSSAFNGHFMYMSGMEQQRPVSRQGGKRRWKENKSTHFHIHFPGNNLWPFS